MVELSTYLWSSMNNAEVPNGTEPTQPLDLAAPAEAQPPAPARRKRGRVIAGVTGVVALALIIGGTSVAAAHKSVTLTADGTSSRVGTFSSSVASLLADRGVTVGTHDVVTPALDTQLADGAVITVERAKPIEITANGTSQTLWTTEGDVGSALAAVATDGRALKMNVTRSNQRAAIDLPLSGAVRIVSVDGKKNVTLDAPTSLQAFLDAQGIKMDGTDSVAVAVDDEGTTVVTIVQWDTDKKKVTSTIDFDKKTVKSDDLYVGTTKVTTKGVDGKVTKVFEITTKDGKQVSKRLVSKKTTTKVVDQVTTVGTKERPAPAASSGSSSGSSSTSTSSSSSGSMASVAGVWAALARCESGGNPRIVSSNGLYHGLYQFTVSTWRSVGGSGLPSQASPAEQTKRAKILQARSGWGQWPACSRKIGVR